MATINGSFTTKVNFSQFDIGYVIPPTIIGTLEEANQYICSKMFGDAWIESSIDQQQKALQEATLIICRLRIKYPQWIYDSYTVFPLVIPSQFPIYLPPLNPDCPGLPDPNTYYFNPPPNGYFDAYNWPPQYWPPNNFSWPNPPPNCPPSNWIKKPHGIPLELRQGCYEIALGLLQGIDPNKEIHNLMVIDRVAPGTRVSYQRTQIPEYIRAGVPTASAWALIRPFLADPNAIRTVRS